MLISVDWVPPYWCPSRRLLRSRGEGRSLVTRSKIAPRTGAAPPPMTRDRDQGRCPPRLLRCIRPSGGQRHDAGDRPGEGRHLSGNGHHDLVDVLAASRQLSIALAQTHLGLPADRLDLRRQLLRSELEMPTYFRRIPVGPRPFHQRAPGVAVPGLGDTPLPSALPRRVLRGRQAKIAHELARVVEPRDIPEF